MEKKCWYKSKTLWFNALSTGSMVIDYLSGMKIIPVREATVVIGIVNIFLRSITNKGLK